MTMMKMLIVSALSLATMLPATANESGETRREIKLKAHIEQLTANLRKSRLALAEAQFARGIDTTTVFEQPIVIEEVVEEKPKVVVAPNPTIQFTPLQIDSVLAVKREREMLENFDNYFDRYILADSTITVSGTKSITAGAQDTIYMERLQSLASPIGLPYNIIVKDYINRYTSKSSGLMTNILTRSQFYFPSIEEELIRQDLPVELRAMAIVESALITKAQSYAGAAGLWQFMPATGKVYGLEINSLVDERCDPTKSTIAACKFMKDLYDIYGDWSLAIAAYNCGPGNVNKALARSGLKEGTYWDIYDYLPRETRGYVPAFIAASYAYAYHDSHGIEIGEPTLPIATDTVTINKITHLGQVAEVLDLPIEVLRDLNPQYRRDIIPATTKSYTLTLPQRYTASFVSQEEMVHAKDSTYLKEYINPANIERLKTTPSGTVYRVRRGDTLGGIARKYHVSTRQLVVWNNLPSANKLSIGQRLKVGN